MKHLQNFRHTYLTVAFIGTTLRESFGVENFDKSITICLIGHIYPPSKLPYTFPQYTLHITIHVSIHVSITMQLLPIM